MLTRRIAARHPPPTCLPKLRWALLDEWCNIPQDQIDNLILSIPRRFSTQTGQIQEIFCMLTFAVAPCFARAPFLRPPLAILFFIKDRPSVLFSSFATFLLLPRLSLVDFRVGIGLSSSKNAAADYENLKVATDEHCAAVTLLNLL
ncbi:hypothetical protein TNCV_3469071 [Trichonephila clavipes]|nr:hypothetical protein TNCV_3469071 [Trichonephila clavipes]